jgi:hypothetical protein
MTGRNPMSPPEAEIPSRPVLTGMSLAHYGISRAAVETVAPSATKLLVQP